MFPRLPRLLRVALIVCSLSFFLLLLLRSGGDHHPSVPSSGGSDVMASGGSDAALYPRRLPSPVFQGLLSAVTRKSHLVTPSNKRTTLLSRLNLTTVAGPLPESTALPKKKVVNPHDFRYLLNPVSACRTSNGGHVGLLVYVHSAPANLKKRQGIRQTWGERSLLQRYNATLVFIIGTVNDSKLSSLVLMESEQYGDIVQEDFVDSYRNLTFKAIAGLKWAATYCHRATYILKTDDDILVNLHQVVDHIRHIVEPQYGRRRLILCNQWLRMKIIRDKKSKWYIPEQDFPGDYFPPYCSGSAFLLSGDMARLMYEASLVTRFFWVDDYYITGALIKQLDIKHRRLNQAYSLNPSVAEGKFRNDTRHELFFFHLHKLRVLYGLWKNMTQAVAPPSAPVPKFTRPSSVRLVASAA